MRVETEGGGWVDDCPPPLTKKQLRKRVKELEERLEAIKQRTYVQVTFSQQGHGQGSRTMTQSFIFRRGESMRVQLTRMYLANNAPVWDVVPVEVTCT